MEETQDLHAALGTAIDAAMEAPNESPAVVEPSPEPAATESTESDSRPRDASGRFLPKSEPEAPQEQAPVEQQQPVAQQPQEQAQAVDLPPSTWTPAAKAEYANLSPVVKAEMKKREADFQKGISAYKTGHESYERLTRIAQPYEPLMRASGMTLDQTVQDLLNTNYLLATASPQEKGKLLMQAAQRFGADMTPWMQGQQEPQQPNIESLVDRLVAQRVQPYVQKFETAEQRQKQDVQQQIDAEIQAFRTAADERGQPKYPYFDDVRGLMGAILEVGNAKTMDEAYVMACRAHPEVSKVLSAEQHKAQEAQRLEAARKAAEDAKRNQQANVTGTGAVGLAPTRMSIEQDLAARMEGVRI